MYKAKSQRERAPTNSYLARRRSLVVVLGGVLGMSSQAAVSPGPAIARQARAQVARLAHVEHTTAARHHAIDAGLVGQ